MNKNIIIAILILVFLGIVFFLDWPAFEQISRLREEIRDYNKLIAEKEELAAKVEQLKSVYENKQGNIKKVYYALPRTKEVPEIIVQLEALASENGLILEKIDIQEIKKQESREENGAGVNTLKISLAVSGTYSSFKSFLEALEYNIRVMDIQSIKFSLKKTEQEAPEFLDFNIDLEVYYQ